MENEIITNNENWAEVATQETVEAATGGNFKLIAAIGLGAVASVIIYERIAKPLITKLRERNAVKNSIKANAEVYQENVIDEDELINMQREND